MVKVSKLLCNADVWFVSTDQLDHFGWWTSDRSLTLERCVFLAPNSIPPLSEVAFIIHITSIAQLHHSASNASRKMWDLGLKVIDFMAEQPSSTSGRLWTHSFTHVAAEQQPDVKHWPRRPASILIH